MKAFILAALLAATPALATEQVSGPVTKVRDGDTFLVKGVPIRLNGIDAPEMRTQAGKAARYAVERIIAGQPLTCTLTGDRSYDRMVGTCYLPDGKDVGEELIRQGYALDCPRYSKGRYRHAEPTASRYKLTQSKYCNPR